jgi:hypothetical protein
MSGGTLKVNPPVLQSAATSFGQAADGLGSLQAAASLADAAATVPSLQIAVASLGAQSDVAAETTALADGAHKFSGNPSDRGTLVRKTRSGDCRSDQEDRDPEVAVYDSASGGSGVLTAS